MTLSFYIRKDQPKANGEHLIYLRLTQNRKTKWLSTGISVKRSEWNNKGEQIRKSHRSHKSLNSRLDSIRERANQTLAELSMRGRVTPKDVIESMKQSQNSDFFSVADKVVMRKGIAYDTKKQAKHSLKNLEEYIGERYLPFQNLTYDFIQAYIDNLSLRYAGSTIRKQIQPIKKVTSWAVRNRFLAVDPFMDIKTPKEDLVTPKPKLTEEQLQKIKNLDLVEYPDEYHVRNAFMFSFYSFGLRWADLCTLRWENIKNGELEVIHRKTGKPFSMSLTPLLEEILSKYSYKRSGFIFPFLRDDNDYSDPNVEGRAIAVQNAKANRKLKIIAKLAGIDENLTTHIARHTFANYASQELNIYELRQSLNHSKLETTQRYISQINTKERDRVSKKVYDKLL